MKLKNRLIISFFIMIFVPVLMTLGVFALVGIYIGNTMQESYGIEYDSAFGFGASSIQLLARFSDEAYEDLAEVCENDPESLESASYLNAVNNDLLKHYSFLVIKKEGSVFYYGDSENNDYVTELLDTLDTLEEENSDYSQISTYVGGNVEALIRQISFEFSDGSSGSIFIITRAAGLVPELRQFIVDMLLSVVMILFFTAAMLTVWTYTGIVTPVRRLQSAARNIKEGKLDFSLEMRGEDDEIGQLYRDFEQMRRQLEENASEKLRYDRSRKEMMRNISHDLKTPITSIKGYVEGIMDGVADTPEKQERYLKIIYNKANEMDALIDELTLFSQLDTNEVPYNFQRISAHAYFDDCAEEISLDLREHAIGFHYENFCEPQIYLMADPEKLKRAIDNIIGNAVKYIDKTPGHIRLTVREMGAYVQIEIEDNGKGIAQGDLPYIFDRFYRTDESRNSATGGSGIGLSIVSKIVEDHQGRIWVTSEIGQGTCMYIALRKADPIGIEKQEETP